MLSRLRRPVLLADAQEGAPTIVTPSAVAGLEFKPEVQTVNALVHTLAAKDKIKAFVVLLHQDGRQRSRRRLPGARNQPDAFMDVNKCVNFNGPGVHLDRQRPR